MQRIARPEGTRPKHQSIPPTLPDTGYCNIEYNYGSLETNSGVIIGLSYVMVGNEMHIAYSPTDTLHLPFAATWRTETGVYFRNPFIYSDSTGCYIESRDAVRFYANLNILNLPYDNDSPGVSELLMFSGVPTTRVQANASTPSLTVPMATVTAVDSLGYIVYEGLHSFVSKEGDELVFTGDAIRTNYLYLGASADSDTVAVMDRAAYVTYADFRMAVGTLMLESTDTLFGVYTVKDIPVKTDRAQFNVASGILIATGTHWTLKSTDITDMVYNTTTLKQVTAYRPRTAGVAERVITDSQYPEHDLLNDMPDLDNTAAHYKIPGVMIPTTVNPCKCFKEVKSHSFAAGKKIYELSNHLGNVLVTISDRKLQHDEASDGKVDYYLPDVLTVSDVDPYGFSLSDRTGTQTGTSSYRFGFNGQEKDDEVYGEENSYTAQFWEYDPRIARRWNIDPVSTPFLSPYSVFMNSPIKFSDTKGNIIDGDKQAVDAVKVEATKRRTNFQKEIDLMQPKMDKFLNQGKTPPNKLQESYNLMVDLRNEMDNVLDEINQMDLDQTTTYFISKTSSKIGGTTWDLANNRLSIQYSNLSNLVHELKHGFQYLSKKMSYDRSNSGKPGILYDIQDEVEAYQREYKWDTQGLTEFFPTYADITTTNILSIDAKYGTQYRLVYNTPTNITATTVLTQNLLQFYFKSTYDPNSIGRTVEDYFKEYNQQKTMNSGEQIHP